MHLCPTKEQTKKTIILGVTGSIAAYKSADLVSQLRKEGYELFVVMTSCATHFITPLTLQTLSRHPVLQELSNEAPPSENWHPGHIELADLADLLLVAPASANIIAKLAHGLADDALTSVALATKAPLMIAPAMNGKMWEHPATQDNVASLQKRGATFIGPSPGMLACGYEGLGRLAPIEEIIESVLKILTS